MPATFRISGVLVLLLWVWAGFTWANAPDQVPLHFGFSGEPTRWGPRSPLAWFGPAALATLLAVGIGALVRGPVERLDRMSLPGKARLVRVPSRYYGPVRQVVRQIAGWAVLETVVLLSLVQWATIRGAAGEDTRVAIGLVFALALLAAPLLMGMVLRRSARAVDEAVRQAEADGALEPPAS